MVVDEVRHLVPVRVAQRVDHVRLRPRRSGRVADLSGVPVEELHLRPSEGRSQHCTLHRSPLIVGRVEGRAASHADPDRRHRRLAGWRDAGESRLARLHNYRETRQSASNTGGQVVAQCIDVDHARSGDYVETRLAAIGTNGGFLESSCRLIGPGVVDRGERVSDSGPILCGLGRRDRPQCEVVDHVAFVAVPGNLSLEVCCCRSGRDAVCQFGEVADGLRKRCLAESSPDVFFARRVRGSEFLNATTRVGMSAQCIKRGPDGVLLIAVPRGPRVGVRVYVSKERHHGGPCLVEQGREVRITARVLRKPLPDSSLLTRSAAELAGCSESAVLVGADAVDGLAGGDKGLPLRTFERGPHSVWVVHPIEERAH